MCQSRATRTSADFALVSLYTHFHVRFRIICISPFSFKGELLDIGGTFHMELEAQKGGPYKKNCGEGLRVRRRFSLWSGLRPAVFILLEPSRQPQGILQENMIPSQMTRPPLNEPGLHFASCSCQLGALLQVFTMVVSPDHRCPCWLFWWENRWPWFTWWFNHLPGPSICPKRTIVQVGYVSSRRNAYAFSHVFFFFFFFFFSAASWSLHVPLNMGQ